MMTCTYALLLFWHNAQMLLACNYSHILLSIIDSSLTLCIAYCDTYLYQHAYETYFSESGIWKALVSQEKMNL